MAELMIIVVPKDRDYEPGKERIAAAASLLEGFFPDRETDVEYETAAKPMFVTARDAFESLECPGCGETVERFDLEEDDDGATWWDGFEDRLYASKDPQTEVFEMPCCQAKVAAGEMNLGSDATFARLNMWIHRPGDESELTPQQAKQLADALGGDVRWMTGVNS